MRLAFSSRSSCSGQKASVSEPEHSKGSALFLPCALGGETCRQLQLAMLWLLIDQFNPPNFIKPPSTSTPHKPP